MTPAMRNPPEIPAMFAKITAGKEGGIASFSLSFDLF